MIELNRLLEETTKFLIVVCQNCAKIQKLNNTHRIFLCECGYWNTESDFTVFDPGKFLEGDKKQVPQKIKLEIHSADFEENTLTLQLPEGFWAGQGGLTPGFINIDISGGLIEKYKRNKD